VWSRHRAEQRRLETTPLGGALPTARGPYLGVVTQNAAASKLDYWLRRATDYRLARRADGSADVTVTVRLRNAAPPGLPAYVRLRADTGGVRNNPRAQNKLWVSIYTGVGSGFVSARIDGKAIALSNGVERATRSRPPTWPSTGAGPAPWSCGSGSRTPARH